MPAEKQPLPAIATVALTTLMGVHVLRSFLAMVVWNIGVERSQLVLGAVALAVFALGLVGWFIVPRQQDTRWEGRVAVLFAAVYALSHFARHPLLTPALALLSAVGWLWMLPTLLARVARTELLAVLVPGILTGFAAQIALQTALHGLDMAMLRGILPGLGAMLLAAALLITWRWWPPATGGANESGLQLPGWGMAAFGPYLVLQLTLLSNTGRTQVLTAIEGAWASALPLLGLAVGAGVIAAARARSLSLVAAAVAVISTQPAWLSGNARVLLPLAQVTLAVVLSSAFVAREGRSGSMTYLGGAAGLLLAFALMFLYYSRYEWPGLWTVMAAGVVIPALLHGSAGRGPRTFPSALAIAGVGALGLGLGSVSPFPGGQPAAPPPELRLLSYNIRMGFNAPGVPNPEGIARVIESADAEIVALQEVGRGWTVNGGADLVTWLRWRFPQYRLVYGPMNGALWGNAILSRYTIADSGSLRFPIRQSKFQRGLTWAVIPTAHGDFLVISTHFANEAGVGEDRLAQAGDLLAFWRTRGRTTILGDLNAEPQSAPILRLRAAGLQDALAPHGLASVPTFPSPNPSERIDYIFVSRDIESVGGAIPRTTASDHLPVIVRIRLR